MADATSRAVPATWALAIRRCLDVTGATLGLVLTAPLLVVLAVAVALTSRGPILFRQRRIGRDGVPFTMVKFRTMRTGRYEEVLNDPDLWATYVAHDHKLPPHLAGFTPIGQLLRRLNLDELPQLWNVVRGQMSLVGVRPIEASQLALRPAASQQRYCAMRPGLTGLWQVEGRANTNSERRIALDDEYVAQWRLRHDFALLLRTPGAILRMRHAV
ncbi:MAG: sugar transferase [Ilumatobacteraceae bacterium]